MTGWVTIYSEAGSPVRVWESPVPRIYDTLLDSVVYLYPDVNAAKARTRVGGTGFFIMVRSPVMNQPCYYIVTNKHVAFGGCRTVRLNTEDGGVDYRTIPMKKWTKHPKGDDIAVAPVSVGTNSALIVSGMDWESYFATPEQCDYWNVGVGDDIYMLGRFISHEGRARNQPIARFGNIAMMPGEKVLDGNQTLVEAFLIEMRSLPGFSGSPVFIYLPPGSARGEGEFVSADSYVLRLIGIDTGHKMLPVVFHDRATRKPINDNLPWYALQNTGIAIVAPAWRIQQVLDEKEPKMHRKKVDEEFLKEYGDEHAVADVATSEFDNFENLTRKLVNVPKKEVDNKRKDRQP